MEQLAPLLWLMFGGCLLMYTVYGFILGYHWIRFSANYTAALVTLGIYVGFGVLLFVVMFGTLLVL